MQRLFSAFICLVKAGLTGLSGAATTFTTGVAITCAVAGKAVTRAAVTGGVTPTVDAVTGAAITLKAGFATVVVWCLDAAGNVACVQGTTEAIGPSGSFLTAAPSFPTLPDNMTAFAYSIHKASSGTSPLVGTFTFGTSNWSTTGMSHSVTDVITLPSRPQTA